MGTLCQILAFLSLFYFAQSQESSSTESTTTTQTNTLNKFLTSKDDFINKQVNFILSQLTEKMFFKIDYYLRILAVPLVSRSQARKPENFFLLP